MSSSKKGSDGKTLQNIWHIITMIKQNLSVKALRIDKYFETMDKTNVGFLSALEFVNVLRYYLDDLIGLSEHQAQALANFFKATDGRVMYKEFLKCIDFSKDDVLHPSYTTGFEWGDYDKSQLLDKKDENNLKILLDEIAARVYWLQLDLKALFMDYEMATRNMGCMTISQFSTMLETLKLKCKRRDFNLLVRKYSRHNFTLNYIAFCLDVKLRMERLRDLGLLSKYQNLDERWMIDADRKRISHLGDPQDDIFYNEPYPHPSSKQYNLLDSPEQVIRQIMNMMCYEQVNYRQFITPFDELRKGVVTETQFRRFLSSLGIDTTGPAVRFILKPEEIACLLNRYRNVHDPSMIDYNRFCKEVSKLRKFPTMGPHASSCPEVNHFLDLPELIGHTKTRENVWDHASQVHREACENAVMKLETYTKRRNIRLRDEFHFYDKRGLGRILPIQFRNLLLKNQIEFLTPLEMKGLDDRYLDFKGFNYRQLLIDMHENIKFVAPKSEGVQGALFIPKRASNYEDLSHALRIKIKPVRIPSICEVLNKVKLQMRKGRLPMWPSFNQYAFNNLPYISRNRFERALVSAGISLDVDEINVLAKIFATPTTRGNLIDYRLFLETAFSSQHQYHLEKAPLVIPIASFPVEDGKHNFLSYTERIALRTALSTLSRHVPPLRSDNFKAFDKHNFGAVDRGLFFKALASTGRDTQTLLTKHEMDLVYKAFLKPRGTHYEMDYYALMSVLRSLKTMGEDLLM